VSARQPWADPAQMQVRAAAPKDRRRVARFLAAMDRDGLYQRHFSHGEAPNLALLSRLDAVDQCQRVAVLAVASDDEVLGHAEYVVEHGAAEFALMVLPDQRARGIGTALLQALLDLATAGGERRMHGMIQASNTRALKLVLKTGFRVVPGDDATVVIVSRDLAPSRDAAPASAAHRYPFSLARHDPDRTPLHRRPGPGTPLRAGGG